MVEIVDFANLHSVWIKEMGQPFTIRDFESKWDDLHRIMNTYFDLNTCSEERQSYNQLKNDSPPLIPVEVLQLQTTNIRNFSASLN